MYYDYFKNNLLQALFSKMTLLSKLVQSAKVQEGIISQKRLRQNLSPDIHIYIDDLKNI